MMLANYHTHTSRCQHAVGQDRDYVEAALKAGYEILGFSDHSPWPFASGFVSSIRMRADQLDDYIRSVHDLQKAYEGVIRIHLGLEAEYFPRYHDWLERMRDRGVTYYILGQHYADSEEDTPYTGDECVTDEGVLRYAESTVKAIRTGLFAYLAHPDLFMRHRRPDQFNRACEEASDMMVSACLEQHIPIEYNLLGLHSELDGNPRGYPSSPFWAYVNHHHCPVIIGVDAHNPDHLLQKRTREIAVKRLSSMDCEIVQTLPGLG